MPWVDMKEQMEKLDIPLYALESKDALSKFDVIGFTLQYELSYTNILAMLDLAHIPFYAKDRGEDAPFDSTMTCVAKAFVLATPFSSPARVRIVHVASRTIELLSTLQIARLRNPLRLASFSASSVSAVSPLWLIATKSSFVSIIGSR